MLALYREMLRLRKSTPALATLRKEQSEAWWDESARVVMVRRWAGRDEALLVVALGGDAGVEAPVKAARWVKVLDTTAPQWMGERAAFPAEMGAGLAVAAGTVGAAVYRKRRETRRKQAAAEAAVVENEA
mgnify:FL=1